MRINSYPEPSPARLCRHCNMPLALHTHDMNPVWPSKVRCPPPGPTVKAVTIGGKPVRYVMVDAAYFETATPEEIDRMLNVYHGRGIE